MSKIKYMFERTVQILQLESRLMSRFGFKVGFYDFLKIFIFRSNKSKINQYIYKRKYAVIQEKLVEKYPELINICKDIEPTINTIARDSTIWFFWYQGLDESTPLVVQKSWDSINTNKGSHKVILIWKENIDKYVNLPSFYYEKLGDAYGFTHFSDILRIELLAQYGGIWMDATIILHHQLPEYIYDMPFYTIKHMRYTDWHVCKGIWTGFFLAASKNNPYFMFLRSAFRIYWEKEDVLIAYLLIDCMISIGYHNSDVFRKMIDEVPVNNTTVFYLDEHGNESLNPDSDYIQRIDISKLHYKKKFIGYDECGKLTNFGYLMALLN